MEPATPRPFPPVEAGALLAAVTAGTIGAGALVGWLAGSLEAGVIAGCVAGIPAGVTTVYFRYHTSL